MITDTLAQCHRYTDLSPHFTAAFEFLKNLPVGQPDGRYDFDSGDCFALVQSYITRPVAQALFEAHRQYIDIQYLQAGCETILWAPLATLTEVTQPYSAEKDITFYARPAHWTSINLHAGQFSIFFPDDAHAPNLECHGPAAVRKTVIKVRA